MSTIKEESIPLSESVSFFQKQTHKSENKVCFDCQSKNPQWASIPFGIYICVDCASSHRLLGTHITFVRSITIDSWKPSQLRIMKCGGNLNARIYFSEHGIANEKIDQKYISNSAINYRKLLETKAAKLLNETNESISSVTSTPNQSSPLEANATTAVATLNKSGPSPNLTNKSNPSPLSISNSSPLLVDTSSNSQESTPKQQTVVVADDSEWDDFDKKVSITRSSKKPVVAKTSTTKRISKQSFDDDWDSIPETSTNKSSSTNKNVQTDKSPTNQSPELRSNKQQYSSIFDVEETIQEPLYNQKKNKNTSSTTRDNYNNDRDFEFHDSGKSVKSKESNDRNDSSDYARKNFSNAKSISSQQYFGDDKDTKFDPEKQARLSAFQGATSISSAQYYNRDESPKLSDMRASDIADKLMYLAKTDIRSLSNAVMDGSKKLTNMASNAYQDFQERYR
ncbi:Arf GTPase activating protein [Heterostelium album PN500]|uniref:Arf GTPase activating protein n=1 Tax=Heterostelium pallidum (strain ATCC 26659 / Pp 5 / PN500) TaxID=670386 RepID=D3BK33_HETP5|nr:Arf GTPase activating protein [Heterostelium album PN500]EFA78263.1 Arf GTPase activating protein [Heterostelium album PN500]|eukprot:XP_020430388.1 Arf GTPase activating protein [Heterostelium album PN500]